MKIIVKNILLHYAVIALFVFLMMFPQSQFLDIAAFFWIAFYIPLINDGVKRVKNMSKIQDLLFGWGTPFIYAVIFFAYEMDLILREMNVLRIFFVVVSIIFLIRMIVLTVWLFRAVNENYDDDDDDEE